MMLEITNFYEGLVITQINDACEERNINLSDDAIHDIACLSLNQLPPRYIRHAIDAIFYIPEDERLQMTSEVKKAVNHAISKVIDNPRQP